MTNREYLHHIGLKYWHQNIKSIESRIQSEKKLRKVKKKLASTLSPTRVDRCMKQLSIRPMVILRRMQVPEQRQNHCSKSIWRARVSNGSTVELEASCGSDYTECSSTEGDDPPELLAEAVGSRFDAAFRIKKPVKLKLNMVNTERGKECSIKSSNVSPMQVGEDDDEYNRESSSKNSTMEVSESSNTKSVEISDASINNRLQTQEEDISHDQKLIEAESPILLKKPTRICSAKSQRISRVVPTGTQKKTSESMKAASNSSSADQDVMTEISEKLARIRNKLKVYDSRKVRKTHNVSYKEKWKRRKCENTLDLFFLSDTDQESDVTASTVDDDESNNAITDMDESSMTQNESEDGSTLSDSLCNSNIKIGDEQRISSITNSNTKKRNDCVSMPNCYRRESRAISNIKLQTDHHELKIVRENQFEEEKQQSGRNSIDSGIWIQEASPLQSPLPIAMEGLPRLDDYHENVIDSRSIERSCTNPSQPNSKLQLLNLDGVLRGETKVDGIMVEFFSESSNSLERDNDMCVEPLNIRSDPTFVPSPDSSISEKVDDNHSTNSSAINIVSESSNSQNQELLSGDRSNIIDKDEESCIEEMSEYLLFTRQTHKESVDKQSVEAIVEDSKNPSETVSTLEQRPIHNTSNEKSSEEIADSVISRSEEQHSIQIKDTYQQQEKIVPSPSSLPPKKRPFINQDFDNKISEECVESKVSTGLNVLKPTDLNSKCERVTPVIANKPTTDTNNSQKPKDQNINHLQLLCAQVVSTPLINNQLQSSVQLQTPIQLQYQVQPQGLVVNMATTMQQSHAIVVDNRIPPVPLGILSYLGKIEKPTVPVTPIDKDNLAVQYPSKSIPVTIALPTSAPITTTTTSASVHVSTAPSTSAADKPPTSNLVGPPPVPSTSTGSSIQPSPQSSNSPSDINLINDQSIVSPTPTETKEKSSEINETDQKLIEYTECIIRNIMILRGYSNSMRYPLAQSDLNRICMQYKSIAAHITFDMENIQELEGYPRIFDVFTFIVMHSSRTMSAITSITFGELKTVYKTYLACLHQLPASMQNSSSRHSKCNSICPPPYSNYNHSIIRSPQLPLPPLLPIQPPPQQLVSSASTSSSEYRGTRRIRPQITLKTTDIPVAVPSSAVSMPRQSNAHSQLAPSSYLSASQHELLKIQISTYRNIYSAMKFELDKYHNMLLYNESLRQLQHQELIASQQQQIENQPLQQQADPTIRHNQVSQINQQQSLIDEQNYVTECNRIAIEDALLQPQQFQAADFEYSEASSSRIISATAATSITEAISSIENVLSTSMELKGKRNVGNYVERNQTEKPHKKENKKDTKKIKEELIVEPKMEIKEETPESENNPSTADSFNDDRYANFCDIKKDEDDTVDLITLDDSDDETNCIPGTSTHRETAFSPTDKKIDGIHYNQSSIDEELECEALSKKLGIQTSSYFEDAPIEKSGVPVISSVTAIDNHTFEHFNEGFNNNSIINDDIIDLTDSAVKSECNIASPQSDYSETGEIDFVGEMIQGSLPRPNCFNCKKNRGEIVCECGEVTYCSLQCLKVHWRKFHSNVCKGPPIDINSIDEITLDDD